VRGFALTRIDQVHQSLFSPDLVREALAGDPADTATPKLHVLAIGINQYTDTVSARRRASSNPTAAA